MEINVVETYLEEVLHNGLEKLGIEEKYIQIIKQDIKPKMYSLLYHWEDVTFRKAVLITGMEEGFFYEPDADIDVKNFVVVAIRNSYLEDIFSVNCKSLGLDKPLDEILVRRITGEAIEYFKEIDFVKLSENINKLEIEDFYGDIVKEFPLAWNSLIQLGNCIGKKTAYEKKTVQEKVMTQKLNAMCVALENSNESHKIKDIKSGINQEISNQLINKLKDIIKEKNGVLYVDCFKMITRNFKQLLFVIEILLENECGLVTSNFLITDSYIGKREFLLRAAHTTNEVKEKLKNSQFFNGLSKTHRKILEGYVKVMSNIE